MFRSIVFVLIVIASSAVCFSEAKATTTEQPKIEQVKKHLNHANTYYWLSRARGNDIIDIRKNIFHAQQALAMLKNEVNTEQILQLKYRADSAISEANAQMGEASDTIGSFSPLYFMLTGQEAILENFDDAEESAIERSVENILKIIKVPTKVSQLYIIIAAENANLVPEEIAHDYINHNTSHYAITRHELSRILSKQEINSLYDATIPNDVLKKISTAYSTDGIGILNIFQNDIVDRVSYWGSNYNYWESKSNKYGYFCYADGFCESSTPYWALLILLICLGFPATGIFNLFNKRFNAISKGSYAPAWLGFLSAAFSLLVVIMGFKGLSILDIDNRILILSPLGIGWITAITLILVLLPILLSYIGAARIPRIGAILNNPEIISSVIFGACLGSLTWLSVLAAQRLSLVQSITIAIPAVAVIGVVALRIGIACSKSVISNDKASEIEYIFLILTIIIYTLFVLLWKFEFLLAASIISLILTALASYIPSQIVCLKAKIYSKTGKIVEDDVEQKTGISWLRQEIKVPLFFVEPWKNIFDTASKFITDNTDSAIEVVFIEADSGCGKTRTANEIARLIKQEYENKNYRAKILFGDCDEFSQETDTIPYEPFAQALGSLLGVGRFSNPAEKADSLKSGLVGLGLKTVMNATGMGALGSLLDAKDDVQTRKTNTKEMAYVVAEALSDLSKKQNGQDGKVIFIIDDTQWMDDESYEMLKLLFEALKEFKDNQVSFIFTSRPVSEDDKVKKLIGELENIKDVNAYRGINGQILENDEIVEGILDNLKFDFRTKQSLAEFFRKKRIQRPLHILQTIETLIEREMIEPFSDRFVLSKNANLKKLPPPDDFKSMVKEELRGLDQRIISVLQCCAVMGRSFRVSIIASIFNIDLLELLDLFKDAEERGIIRDVAQEDDTYEFSEKRMVGIFRELKSSPMEEEHISQKVREYHKRFVNKAEKEINDEIDSAPYRDILSLASHSHAIRDAFPEKAFYYNRIAAEKTYAKGMFNAANRFYKNAFEIINADKAKVAIEETLKLYISYAKCLLDEQSDNQIISECINKAHELLNTKVPIENSEWAMMEISLIEALNNYRTQRFEDAIDSSNSVLKNKKASLVQKSRAMFYRAISLPPSEVEVRKTAHLEVLAEAENILKTPGIPDTDRLEILKVKSEALNNTGLIFLFGLKSPDEALKYFEMAIKINELPEINDQKGVAIAHGGMGDCFKTLNQLDKAENEYEINLNISQKTGDNQGICRMTSVLGAIKIEKGKKSDNNTRKKLLAEAEKLYEQSLATAENQKNITNICFALAGMLETILVSGSYDRTEYIFSKLEVIRKQFDFAKIPDFAKNALTVALNKIMEITPKYNDLIKSYRSEI